LYHEEEEEEVDSTCVVVVVVDIMGTVMDHQVVQEEVEVILVV
jgi:hypothetical protein